MWQDFFQKFLKFENFKWSKVTLYGLKMKEDNILSILAEKWNSKKDVFSFGFWL